MPKLTPARYPDADAAVRDLPRPRPGDTLDVLFVNPPAPDGAVWIRSQHRVGRRSRENMIWPQVDLAQMAALLMPDYPLVPANSVRDRGTLHAGTTAASRS